MANPGKPTLNVRGAVDLSALANARKAEADAAAAKATAPVGTIIDVTEASFQQDVIERSKSAPVVVDFWADWCGPCKQLSPILEKLTAQAGGKIVLAKIDSDREQRLAAAFQVQSIPSVFLVLNGQVQPLFQGAVPEAQLKPLFDQLLQAAAQLPGAEAAAAPTGESPLDPAEPPVDSRYTRAVDAFQRNDWEAARAAFKEMLAENPADAEAKAGLAQVALAERMEGVDPVKAAAAVIASPADRLQGADALIMLGQDGAALDRLLEGVRSSTDADRDAFKDRLLELFSLIGDTVEVRQARRKLTNLLF